MTYGYFQQQQGEKPAGGYITTPKQYGESLNRTKKKTKRIKRGK